VSTALVLGNGNMLVNLDDRLQITDLYWPHVGKNNHLVGHHIRNYLWDYGNLISFEDPSFKITVSYEKDSLTGKSTIVSEKYGIKIVLENIVLPHKDIYLAKYTVTNLWDMNRNLKFFVNHDFYIKEHNAGDTACFYPLSDLLLHYKDDVYLGIGSTNNISQYSCDRSHSNGGVGTLPDLKTGKLNGYPIYRGAVESTIGIDISINGGDTKTFDYFIVAEDCLAHCRESADFIRKEGTEHILNDVTNFWKSYITSPIEDIFEKENTLLQENFDAEKKEEIKDIFVKSIGIMRTQIDNSGLVTAANDSFHLKYRRDTYSYLWHRDGSYAVSALDELGYSSISEKFFKLSAELIEPDGFFLHNYNPSGHLGTSWHPWIDPAGNPQLPIQEDSTATTLWAIWKSYEKHKNHELIAELWEPLIRPMADFLCNFRYCKHDIHTPKIVKEILDSKKNKDSLDECFADTELPMASFDLWEERSGVYTYTCASVYGGLLGASILALKLGQHEEAEKYSKIAYGVKQATLKYLYDDEEDHFIHGLMKDYATNTCIKSKQIDASISRIWFFEMLPADDVRVVTTIKWLEKELWNPNSVGGILRYKGDDYYRLDKNQNGNPWFITTLWFAQYYIQRNQMDKAMKYITWILDNTKGTSLMPEQLDCVTGEAVSVKPLTWSHAEWVRTVKAMTR
jgi:glucoamylase